MTNKEVENNLFKVTGFEFGNHDFDTLFIEADGQTVQIPVNKEFYDSKVIGQTIKVEYEIVDGKKLFTRHITKKYIKATS